MNGFQRDTGRVLTPRYHYNETRNWLTRDKDTDRGWARTIYTGSTDGTTTSHSSEFNATHTQMGKEWGAGRPTPHGAVGKLRMEEAGQETVQMSLGACSPGTHRASSCWEGEREGCHPQERRKPQAGECAHKEPSRLSPSQRKAPAHRAGPRPTRAKLPARMLSMSSSTPKNNSLSSPLPAWCCRRRPWPGERERASRHS